MLKIMTTRTQFLNIIQLFITIYTIIIISIGIKNSMKSKSMHTFNGLLYFSGRKKSFPRNKL